MNNSDRIQFDCPQCGKAILAARDAGGKRARCPKCKELVVVPQPHAVKTEDEDADAGTEPVASRPLWPWFAGGVTLLALAVGMGIWLSTGTKRQAEVVTNPNNPSNPGQPDTSTIPRSDLRKKPDAAPAATLEPPPPPSPKLPASSAPVLELAPTPTPVKPWDQQPKDAGAFDPVDAGCERPSISGNGRFVAFESEATNLVSWSPAQVALNHERTERRVYVRSNVFVHDLATRKTICASVDKDDNPIGGVSPQISSDGSKVVYLSPPSTTVSVSDARPVVFVFNMKTGTSETISITDEAVDGVSLSPDGRWLFLQSRSQIRLREISTGKLMRIDDGTTVTGRDSSYMYSRHAWSGNSRFCAFGSINNGRRLFIYDVVEGKLDAVALPSPSERAPLQPLNPSLSEDGQQVLFTSDDGPSNSLWLYNRKSKKLGQVRLDGIDEKNQRHRGGILGPDASFILYPGPLGDSHGELLLHKLDAPKPILLSKTPGGKTARDVGELEMADRGISSDGRFVVFTSGNPAGALDGGTRSGYRDVWVVDRASGKVHRASVTCGTRAGIFPRQTLAKADLDKGMPAVRVENNPDDLPVEVRLLGLNDRTFEKTKFKAEFRHVVHIGEELKAHPQRNVVALLVEWKVSRGQELAPKGALPYLRGMRTIPEPFLGTAASYRVNGFNIDGLATLVQYESNTGYVTGAVTQKDGVATFVWLLPLGTGSFDLVIPNYKPIQINISDTKK